MKDIAILIELIRSLAKSNALKHGEQFNEDIPDEAVLWAFQDFPQLMSEYLRIVDTLYHYLDARPRCDGTR